VNLAGKLTILLVEDNPLSQKLAYYVLRKGGHEVVTADNGVAALEFYEKRRFDLILMDVRMPRMDGLQTTMAIRERERHSGRHIPIIALTANAMAGDREACMQAGMDECLIKPIQPAALIASIARLSSATPATLRPAYGPRAVLDQLALLERLGGDRELLEAMTSVFFRDCERIMSQSRHALAHADSQGLADLLHTLCGMFRNLSADAALAATLKLQELDVRNDPAGAQACFSVLETEVRLLNQKLAGLRSWQPGTRRTHHVRSAAHVKPLG
jgi:CheY-like chemotaxis protein/HPt (histidine-containing phosphotransfer) domain-containing protein